MMLSQCGVGNMAVMADLTKGTLATRASTRLRQDGRGVTAVEYGIVAAFLCLVLLGIFSKFGAVLVTMFNRASSGI